MGDGRQETGDFFYYLINYCFFLVNNIKRFQQSSLFGSGLDKKRSASMVFFYVKKIYINI